MGTLSAIGPHDFGDTKTNALHEHVRATDEAWRQARSAREPDEKVRALVQAYIDACAAFQKARFGKVRVRMSVVSVLR